jgi:hypothetical protein
MSLHSNYKDAPPTSVDQPDPVSRLRTLEREFTTALQPEAAPAASRPAVKKAVKIAIGVAMLAAFGVVPARTMLAPSSVDAVVNRRVTILRAPIDGVLEGSLADGAGPLSISNERADTGRLDDYRSRLSRAAAQRKAAGRRLVEQEQALARLQQQGDVFQRGRVEQLTARIADLKAQAAVAAARRDEAQQAYGRAVTLARSNSLSAAELGRVTRDRTVADETAISAQQQLAAAAVELAAARDGVFIGDSYNDRPSSMQAADEARRRIADLTADIDVLDGEVASLTQDAADEADRWRKRAQALLQPPAGARLWEVLAAPGEQVRAGQDLARYVDCAHTVVTAAVTETVYNKLTAGQAARFIPTDGGAELVGRVTELTGSAGVAGNLAIGPNAFGQRGPYRVNVDLPSAGPDCAVGRTGRVLFGDHG